MIASWLKPCCPFLLFTIASNAFADHIPGHDPLDKTFPIPLPDQEFFDGGILFGTFIGPVEGTEILHTTYDITFISDGTTPASDLLIEMTVMADDDFREFLVTGADLGFGAGPGTFSGTFETDAFNGTVWQPAAFPHSLVDLNIGSINGGIEGSGYFEDSFIVLDVIPVPEPSSLTLIGVTACFWLSRRTQGVRLWRH